MCTGNKSNDACAGVELSNPDTRSDFNQMEKIEIYFNSSTKKLAGLGILRMRNAQKGLNENSTIGENEGQSLMPCSEEFIDLLNQFVHDLCSISLYKSNVNE